MDTPLEEKVFTKYLGVLIDQNLNWTYHIEHVNQQINKGIGMLSRLRHYVPLNNLRQIFFALVQSHINYAILNWGFSTPTHLNKIIISMKKCVRVMLFKKREEHSNPLFNSLKLLDFQNNFNLKLGQFLWYIKNKIYLPDLIQKLFDVHSRSFTRQDFSLSFPQTQNKRSSIFFHGVKFWNDKIPSAIKKSPTPAVFTKKYSDFLANAQGFSYK